MQQLAAGLQGHAHQDTPQVFHKERGLALRPPLAWELELMEG